MLRTLLFILIMFYGVWAAMFDRFAALLLYLWFALFRPQEWVWINISDLRLSLFIGVLFVVPSMLGGVFPNVLHPLSVGTLVFLASGLLAQTQAVAPELGLYWLDYLARLIVVALLAVTLINTPKRFMQVLTVMSGSIGYYAAKAGLASLFGGGVKFSAGVGGAFADNNGYALATIMIVFLLIAVAQNAERRWVRAGFYVAAPLSAFAVVSLFSRGGFLGLIVASLVFMLLQRRKFVWLSGVTALALVGLLVAPLPEGWLDRIKTIQTYEKIGDESALSRLHFWHVAVDMARTQPLGIGLRNYEAAYDRYDFSLGKYGHQRSVHSSHFQVLAETGYLGAGTWIGLFLVAFFLAFRVRHRSRDERLAPELKRLFFTCSNALIASMVGFLIGGAFIALALNDLTWLTFALVAALDRLSSQAIAAAGDGAVAAGGARIAGGASSLAAFNGRWHAA